MYDLICIISKKYLWWWKSAANSWVPGFGRLCDPRSRSLTEADNCAAAVPPREYDLGPIPFSETLNKQIIKCRYIHLVRYNNNSRCN